MLDMDAGSRYPGRTAPSGANYTSPRYTQNTLFDEKIGGTFHLPWAPAIPKPAARTRAACTGTWSATCATAASSRSTARISAERQVSQGRLAEVRAREY